MNLCQDMLCCDKRHYSREHGPGGGIARITFSLVDCSLLFSTYLSKQLDTYVWDALLLTFPQICRDFKGLILMNELSS